MVIDIFSGRFIDKVFQEQPIILTARCSDQEETQRWPHQKRIQFRYAIKSLDEITMKIQQDRVKTPKKVGRGVELVLTALGLRGALFWLRDDIAAPKSNREENQELADVGIRGAGASTGAGFRRPRCGTGVRTARDREMQLLRVIPETKI